MTFCTISTQLLHDILSFAIRGGVTLRVWTWYLPRGHSTYIVMIHMLCDSFSWTHALSQWFHHKISVFEGAYYFLSQQRVAEPEFGPKYLS